VVLAPTFRRGLPVTAVIDRHAFITAALDAGVVVDTMVISWLLDDRPNPLADRPLSTHAR
jgi:hypothetical protein